MNRKYDKPFTDTHFHVFAVGKAVADARYAPDYAASLTDWMTQASSVGVRNGVLVQPSFLGADNRLMVQELKAHPDALRGVAVVQADAGLEQLKTLHASGVRGIRLNVAGGSHEIPQWTRADGLWQAMAELGWHLELHTDKGGLPKVLDQLPVQLPLVIDHMGKPDKPQADDPTFAALIRRARCTRIHVKLSGAYRLGGLDPVRVAHIWLQELGASALLWGSDWPCTNHEAFARYAELFASLESWIGTGPIQQVLIDNPARLYWGLA